MSQKMPFRSYSDSFRSRNFWICELPHLPNPGNEPENVNFAFFDTFPDRNPRRMNHERSVSLAEPARVGYVGVRRGTPLDETVEEWIEEHRAKPELEVPARKGPVIVR